MGDVEEYRSSWQLGIGVRDLHGNFLKLDFAVLLGVENQRFQVDQRYIAWIEYLFGTAIDLIDIGQLANEILGMVAEPLESQGTSHQLVECRIPIEEPVLVVQ